MSNLSRLLNEEPAATSFAPESSTSTSSLTEGRENGAAMDVDVDPPTGVEGQNGAVAVRRSGRQPRRSTRSTIKPKRYVDELYEERNSSSPSPGPSTHKSANITPHQNGGHDYDYEDGRPTSNVKAFIGSFPSVPTPTMNSSPAAIHSKVPVNQAVIEAAEEEMDLERTAHIWTPIVQQYQFELRERTVQVIEASRAQTQAKNLELAQKLVVWAGNKMDVAAAERVRKIREEDDKRRDSEERQRKAEMAAIAAANRKRREHEAKRKQREEEAAQKAREAAAEMEKQRATLADPPSVFEVPPGGQPSQLAVLLDPSSVATVTNLSPSPVASTADDDEHKRRSEGAKRGWLKRRGEDVEPSPNSNADLAAAYANGQLPNQRPELTTKISSDGDSFSPVPLGDPIAAAAAAATPPIKIAPRPRQSDIDDEEIDELEAENEAPPVVVSPTKGGTPRGRGRGRGGSSSARGKGKKKGSAAAAAAAASEAASPAGDASVLASDSKATPTEYVWEPPPETATAVSRSPSVASVQFVSQDVPAAVPGRAFGYMQPYGSTAVDQDELEEKPKPKPPTTKGKGSKAQQAQATAANAAAATAATAERRWKAIEDQQDKIWTEMARKHIPKVQRSQQLQIQSRQFFAKRLSVIVTREAKRAATRTKGAKDVQIKAKRVMKEMLVFWKGNEKKERDSRKKAEKEALDRAKKEEEMRESKRQAKKLNFLITQTELYSHFVGNKIKTKEAEESAETSAPSQVIAADGGPPSLAAMIAAETEGDEAVGLDDIDFDDDDDSKMHQVARRNAQNAIDAAKQRAEAFDVAAGTRREGQAPMAEDDEAPDLNGSATLLDL